MPPQDDTGRVHCRLDELLAARGMTLARLAELVGVTVVNLSVLKNDRAKAIRFSTLTAICDVLGCQVGDLLVVTPATGRPAAATPPRSPGTRG
ncbi:helix-turn-helix transcriptional regulator [Cellulomonas sp. NPDC089187]|uniref:helix-turn-helix domain-containing protein n=1 Tax=Cellulomonas sp. NPDC089187 TaxID=3154970 RepID=UPI003431E9D7